LHEARKQTKYLALALEAMGATGTYRVVRAVRRAKAIGDQLGVDHDLSLIQSKLTTLPSAQLRTCKTLPPEILGRRTRLQRKAFHNGKRLYKAEAQSFAKLASIS
jgi:CHAD domain-containing protein